MIKRNDYIKAREVVAKYEEQLDLSLVSSSALECYIMHRTTDDLIFVLIDKDYANRLYKSGDYVMKICKMLNV